MCCPVLATEDFLEIQDQIRVLSYHFLLYFDLCFWNIHTIYNHLASNLPLQNGKLGPGLSYLFLSQYIVGTEKQKDTLNQ